MPNVIDWLNIEKFMLLGNSYKQTAELFNVKEDTIRKRAQRYQWPLPSLVTKLAAEITVQQTPRNCVIAEKTAKNLAERGEDHANMVFDLANSELKRLKRLPIKNWKDAEIADKTARRSAGMGNDDETSRISIIQLNEAMNAHSLGEDDVIEAELIPGNPEPRLHDAGSDNVEIQPRQKSEGEIKCND